MTENFFVSTDKTLIQIERVHKFLSEKAYWCLGVPKDVVKKAIDNSICFGVYQRSDSAQVGFARVVTDKASFAWLADVYIEEAYRGQGLSKLLMNNIMMHPDLQNLRRFLLATSDAHGLYRQFGFKVTETPDRYMEIKKNDIYRKQ
jgi:N-acetylglutamate synthase-like GNAT family acetyltransferase